jgi:hypothetical protein
MIRLTRYTAIWGLPAAVLVVALSVTMAAATAPDEVTITLVGDVGLNRSEQPVEPDGVRRDAFQTWADTTSLIDHEVNGDLNFMNVETVVRALQLPHAP